MNILDQTLLALLSTLGNASEIGLSTTNLDFTALYAKCERQNITGLAASVLLRLPKSEQPENMALWMSAYIATLQTMTRRNAEFDRMLALMREREIDPICVKGSVLRKLYPDEALRTMGDYDIWVKPEQWSSLSELLSAQGYSLTERPLLYEAEKADVRFEIFTSLEQEFGQDTATWEKFLFENVRRNREGILTLNPTYEIFYIAAHTAKHYVRNGCGIRNLLDIVLLLKHKTPEIDFETVKTLAKAAGVDKVLAYLLSASKVYFGVETPVTTELPHTDRFVEYMLEYGVFGPDKSEHSFTWATQKEGHCGKLRMLFPPYNSMVTGYPFLKKSKLLLPVAWVCRGFKGVFAKHQSPKRIFSDMKASQKAHDDRIRYLTELGLLHE